MKALNFSLLLSCIVCASSTLFCEMATDFENLIVGGHQVSIQKYPFIGAMVLPNNCGVSLIKKDYIITAAHCLVNADQSKINASEFVIRFGSNCYDREGTLVDIEEVEVHPSFSLSTFEYDVGLLKLTPESAEELILNANINIIKIANQNWALRPGTKAWIAGWGRQKEGGSESKVLLEAEVSVLDFKECQYNYKLIDETVSDSMFCAGNFLGGVDACQGDSGGPIVTMRQGQYYLMGVTSWGTGCGRRNFPGVYAKIPMFRDWILDNME